MQQLVPHPRTDLGLVLEPAPPAPLAWLFHGMVVRAVTRDTNAICAVNTSPRHVHPQPVCIMMYYIVCMQDYILCSSRIHLAMVCSRCRSWVRSGRLVSARRHLQAPNAGAADSGSCTAPGARGALHRRSGCSEVRTGSRRRRAPLAHSSTASAPVQRLCGDAHDQHVFPLNWSSRGTQICT